MACRLPGGEHVVSARVLWFGPSEVPVVGKGPVVVVSSGPVVVVESLSSSGGSSSSGGPSSSGSPPVDDRSDEVIVIASPTIEPLRAPPPEPLFS